MQSIFDDGTASQPTEIEVFLINLFYSFSASYILPERYCHRS